MNKLKGIRIIDIVFAIMFVIVVLTGLILPTINKQSTVKPLPLSFASVEYGEVEETDNKSFKMLFVGDVMLARTIGTNYLNGDDPFKNIADKFKEYQIIAATLETTASEPQYAIQNPNKLYTFNAPVSSLDLLTKHNINVVTLANNHSMDFGSEALLNTMQNLKSRGVLYVGSGKNTDEAFAPQYIYYNKTRIAFLAFNDIENWVSDVQVNKAGSAYFDKNLIEPAIKTAKENANIVIVMPHWGIEYNLINSERQAEFGKFFIDSGADIVIGSHPHVLQNSETYQDKMIYYSLGNFVFDDMCPIPNACNAGMVEVNIANKKIESSNLIKVKLSDAGYPELE
jgi:poly-gamma-glutamate capsule biosynthesis protein CapA/YwtB (metallophosphatase superfamily)